MHATDTSLVADVLSSSAARMNSPIPKRPRVSSGKVKQRKRSKAASDTEDSEPDAGSIDDAGCLDDPIIDTVNWVQPQAVKALLCLMCCVHKELAMAFGPQLTCLTSTRHRTGNYLP